MGSDFLHKIPKKNGNNTPALMEMLGLDATVNANASPHPANNKHLHNFFLTATPQNPNHNVNARKHCAEATATKYLSENSMQ